MNLDLLKKTLKSYSIAIRELALESEFKYKPVDKYLYDPYFKPLQLFKTPKKYWDGISLENGEVVYGHSAVETVIFVEEIAFGDPSLYLSLPGPNLSAPLVSSLGTEDQQNTFFDHFVKNVSWSAFSLTEPNAGSDATNLSTIATKKSDGTYELNGKKRYIANGEFSDWYIVFAKVQSNKNITNNSNNALFIETFLFHDEKSPNIIKTSDKTLGQRAARLGKIEFRNYKLSPKQILGFDKKPLRRGFRAAISTFYHMRPATAAIAIGTARAAIEYIRDNKTLTLNDEIIIDKLEWKLQRGRLLTFKAAKMCDDGIHSSKYSSLAKQYMNLLVVETTRECLKIMGNDGFKEHPLLEKWMRDAHMIEFMEGSTNIHKTEVGRQLIVGGIN